jgi:hypothetical protein
MAFADSPFKLNDRCLPYSLLVVMFLILSVGHSSFCMEFDCNWWNTNLPTL